MHFTITGRVQGVGFRAFAQREAVRLHLKGQVWNNPDGSVGILAEGDESVLREFEYAVRRGPIAARVEACQIAKETVTGEFTDFHIRKH